MADESLVDLVLSYLDDDDVALTPGDPAVEARTNTWGYSLPAGPVDVLAAGAALERVANVLRARLSECGESGTFYSWYDEQAGQLRCSLSSASPGRLPFGARYHVVARATDVVVLAAADPRPGFVAWADLAEPEAEETAHPVPPFPVWAVALP
jgi:hypothetical protein